ncbi:MAG TPA: response regulator [Acidimicrobiales bacterium]|nr:response regulator [Acidimicrobiales bacterium]
MDDQGAMVLVADDDEDVLALVVRRLERDGYEVLTARDGAEALRLAQEQLPDLAVLDVMMPQLNGYEVTEHLRQDPATARIPIILLTARVQEHDVSRGFQAGADDYIKKPFSPQELRARVQAALAGR